MNKTDLLLWLDDGTEVNFINILHKRWFAVMNYTRSEACKAEFLKDNKRNYYRRDLPELISGIFDLEFRRRFNIWLQSMLVNRNNLRYFTRLDDGLYIKFNKWLAEEWGMSIEEMKHRYFGDHYPDVTLFRVIFVDEASTIPDDYIMLDCSLIATKENYERLFTP